MGNFFQNVNRVIQQFVGPSGDVAQVVIPIAAQVVGFAAGGPIGAGIFGGVVAGLQADLAAESAAPGPSGQFTPASFSSGPVIDLPPNPLEFPFSVVVEPDIIPPPPPPPPPPPILFPPPVGGTTTVRNIQGAISTPAGFMPASFVGDLLGIPLPDPAGPITADDLFFLNPLTAASLLLKHVRGDPHTPAQHASAAAAAEAPSRSTRRSRGSFPRSCPSPAFLKAFTESRCG